MKDYTLLRSMRKVLKDRYQRDLTLIEKEGWSAVWEGGFLQVIDLLLRIEDLWDKEVE